MAENPNDLDFAASLASQEPFLRRLAGGMISDAQSAQDLTQETLLAAWTQRDRPISGAGRGAGLTALSPARLRAWLSTVLRRKAFSSYRARDTPEGLGPDSALSDGGPSPAEVAERLERQAVLSQALMGLPQDQRDAITLRFQDELSVAQIAALRSTSTNTVKSRIHRGLKAMRDELDRPVPGAVNEGPARGIPPWLAAVAPLARPLPGGLAPAAIGAATKTGSAAAGSVFFGFLTLTLVKATFFILGAVLVVGASYLALSRATPVSPIEPSMAKAPSSTQPPDALPNPGQEVAALAPARVAAGAEPEATKDPADASDLVPPSVSPRTIRGRVLLVSGEPIEGIDVVARVEPTHRAKELARAKSLDDGSFELTFEGDEPPLSAHLLLDVNALAPEGCMLPSVALGDEEAEFRIDGLVVHLSPSSVSDASSGLLGEYLAVTASERRRRTNESTFGTSYGIESYSFKAHVEEHEPMLLSRGPAYSFNVSLGPYSADDQVAYLEKGAPSGIYKLQLSSDDPGLGSVTFRFTGVPLPPELSDSIGVYLRPEGGRVGSNFSTLRGAAETRRSGELPGKYRVEATNNGKRPAGWVIPVITDPEIEVRAGEDTPVEINLIAGGLCRFVTRQAAQPGGPPPIPVGEPIRVSMLLRPAGNAKWGVARPLEFDASGKVRGLPYPKAGVPMVIKELLVAGTYELQLLGSGMKSELVTFEIIPGRFNDIIIDLPPME